MFELIRLASLMLVILALPGMALADPPARVGRLAVAENSVDFQVDRSSRPEPATINWPISDGAVLSTGRRGQAEIWIESTAYRLDGDSELEFAAVDDQRVIVNLDRGTLAINIAEVDQANDLTVRTPEGSIHFASPGSYRIDVFPERTEVATRQGLARLQDDRWQISLGSGRTAEWYAGEPARLLGLAEPDAFDNWVSEREAATRSSKARHYVSPYMTGYQDLDDFGDWDSLPQYGAIWYPRAMGADWAPYRYGSWAWVAPWGWTWIDRAPWGFAPFHYGRWLKVHGRWAWVPGRHEVRPVYSPALVGWAGNRGWTASFNIGSAPSGGWHPLSPHDVYVPVYQHSPRYIRQLNHAHVRDESRIERAVRTRPPEYRPRVEPSRPERGAVRVPERRPHVAPQEFKERPAQDRITRPAQDRITRPAETRPPARRKEPETTPRREAPLPHRERREDARPTPVAVPPAELERSRRETHAPERSSPVREREMPRQRQVSPPEAEHQPAGGIRQGGLQERRPEPPRTREPEKVERAQRGNDRNERPTRAPRGFGAQSGQER